MLTAMHHRCLWVSHDVSGHLVILGPVGGVWTQGVSGVWGEKKPVSLFPHHSDVAVNSGLIDCVQKKRDALIGAQFLSSQKTPTPQTRALGCVYPPL